MSIDELVDEFRAGNSTTGMPCSIAQILNGDDLDDRQKQALEAALGDESIQATAIARRLARPEWLGRRVSAQRLRAHRRGDCRCGPSGG